MAGLKIDDYTSTSTVFTYNYSPPGGLIILTNSTNNYVVAPKIDTSIQLNSLRVKFQYSVLSSASGLIVGVMTDPTDTSTFVPVGEVSTNFISSWEEKRSFV